MNKIREGMPFPVGCVCREGSVNFSVIVERGKQCDLLVFEKEEQIPCLRVPMKEREEGNLRYLEVEIEDPETKEYLYVIDGKEVVDPYVKFLSENGRCTITGKTYDWEQDVRPNIPESEVIAYELHVKGYTAHPSSGVLDKGHFSGVTEKIGHLKELGVNQLQFLPIYEFEDQVQGRKNYWGYGNGLFFLPKRTYGREDAVLELKDMVKTLHRNQIEVILEMPFTEETPQALMLDALRYWTMEYHVDGFLLNPNVTDWKMVSTDPILSSMKLRKRNSEFQNVMRAFGKSDAGMVSKVAYYMKQLSHKNASCNYITCHDGFTLYDLVSYNNKHNEENGECNQDGTEYNVSWNCGAEGATKDKEILRLREYQKRNLLYLLFLSSGSPCILSGDEFGNSQNGNNNVYCQDNETAWLDWSEYYKNQDFFLFLKDLISLRKSYGAFHPFRELDGGKKDQMGIPEISYHGVNAWEFDQSEENRSFSIFCHFEEKREEYTFAMYNMDWKEKQMALPDLPSGKVWIEVANTEKGILKGNDTICAERLMRIGPRNIKVFVGK